MGTRQAEAEGSPSEENGKAIKEGKTMINYTKGKWKVTDSAFSRYSTYRGKATGARQFITAELDEVAEVQGDTIEETKANAQLIAAAPDLYEACKEASEWLVLMEAYIPLHSLILDGLNKALAKVKGK